MTHQLQTIRTLFHGLDMDNGLTEGGDVRALEIYEALSELEAMVGSVEPVAFLNRAQLEELRYANGMNVWAEGPSMYEPACDCPVPPEYVPVYAAPPAQQYEAGDMASAAAQGFRDGVASVAQQPQAEWLLGNDAEDGAGDRQPQAEPDMRKVCEALGFDPTNHHNAAKCPYCRGQQPQAEVKLNYFWIQEYARQHGVDYNELCALVRKVVKAPQQAEAVPDGITLTQEEIEALRHNLSAAVLFNTGGDVRANVLTRFDQFFERVKDHVRPHQPDPEAVAEGLAQIIFEAVNHGKVWMYQSTDTRNAYWQAGQAAKEFLK